jgi:hypothetical protein
LKRHRRVVGADDARKERKGAVVEFHAHSLEGFHGRGDIQQLQDHRLAVAEHRAGGDAKQECVADLAGGAGDGDSNGCVHAVPRGNCRGIWGD